MKRRGEKEYVEYCVRMLAETIGARPAGSDANRKAGDFITSELQSMGYELNDVKFECPDWEATVCELNANGNPVPAEANIYSPSCDVEGEIAFIETAGDLHRMDVEGKIVVAHGDVMLAPFLPENFDRNIYSVPEQDELVAILASSQAAAVITVNHYDGLHPVLLQDTTIEFPSVTVSKHGIKQLEKAAKGKVALKIESNIKKSEGRNIIAARRGRTERRIVICAHYDTAHFTPGAMDNATGVASVLLMCRRLAERDLQHSVEFVFFGGEDSWFPGDMKYITERPPVDVSACINFDGVGISDHRVAVSLLSCSPEIEAKVYDAANGVCDFAKEVFYASDHGFFWPLGIPTMALTSSDMMDFLGVITHTANDNVGIIDYQKVVHGVEISEAMIKAVR